MSKEGVDLVSRMSEEEVALARQRLKSISPDDGKYSKDSRALVPYLSAEAEWLACAFVQKVMLETRFQFGLAKQENVDEVCAAYDHFDPLNAAALEDVTKHDQLAVLEEIGRHVSEETKALLHPGTTSYDILETARAYLFRRAWEDVFRPKVDEVIEKLCGLSDFYASSRVLQTGRTHLQRTSPVPLCTTFALYAARLAERSVKCDAAFGDLRGKVSGIVGTGASVEVVIGAGRSLEFEEAVLRRFGLKADLTATQVVQKERLCDVGNSVVTLMHVLGDFANDVRLLYSSEINEVTSRDGAKRLGGSSADASKNNPINWENIAGKVVVVESGMRVLYATIATDLQRDLRASVMARYQPQGMMAETYEAFCRASKSLGNLSVNSDEVAANLESVQKFPSEAMVAITRKYGWLHPEYGVGHDAVKRFSQVAKKEGLGLLEIALKDGHFVKLFGEMSADERAILEGRLELYVGSAFERAGKNVEYARKVIDDHKFG
jgi:adenylosuccinate lyase